jgi:hypothetical protein
MQTTKPHGDGKNGGIEARSVYERTAHFNRIFSLTFKCLKILRIDSLEYI